MSAATVKESSVLELLLDTARAITSEVDREKLVQRITDIGTELTGAQFGAFFYNVERENGESYFLYTISGVAKEAFSKFPMPRKTKIFEPTFDGTGTVRYDDVTQEKHYGKNDPHHGMPKGHLPVKSYLASPVKNPITGEVIGGLFFGHSDAGIFTEKSEKLVEGIASQAAVAMGNARLFEEMRRTEKRLQEQKEQYASIFNSTSDGLFIFNGTGEMVEMNHVAEKMFDTRKEQWLGLHGQELFKDEGEFKAISQIVNSGRKHIDENSVLVLNGKQVQVQLHASGFVVQGNKQMLFVLKDVSETKKAEEALQRMEDFSSIITRVSPVALWMTNEAGLTTFVNDTWTDWTGLPFLQNLGEGWLKAVVEEERENVQNAFAEAFREKKMFESDFRIRRKDGEIRWCAAHGTPVYKDNVFKGFAGSCIDFTDRKEAEQQVHSQNVLIRTITNNTFQALFLMDDKQYCTYMNPAAELMTGFKLEEVKDRALHYYVHHTRPDGSHFPIEDCPIDRALPTKSQTQGEDVFIHKDGHFYPVAFVASPIIENGVPKGTVIEVRNTTEERKIRELLREQELRKKEELELKVKERTSDLERTNYELLQFASVASHDLKEPLRKISIFGQLLKERLKEVADPVSEKHLQTIIQSSGRMSNLIDDLLSFSRLSQSHIEFHPVDLKKLLDDIVHDLEIPIREKDAEINISELPVIDGISLQLGQVFQNLISNSLKFSHPERKPVINITSSIVRDGDEALSRIVYTDNGIGFKTDHAEKIFEIFQRLHTKDKYEGTGVGLAIVKKIITLHDGLIQASGEEGKGAEFEITLPLHHRRILKEY